MRRVHQKLRILFKISWVNFFSRHPVRQLYLVYENNNWFGEQWVASRAEHNRLKLTGFESIKSRVPAFVI